MDKVPLIIAGVAILGTAAYLVYHQAKTAAYGDISLTEAHIEQVPQRHDYLITAAGDGDGKLVVIQRGFAGTSSDTPLIAKLIGFGRIIEACPECRNITADVTEMSEGYADQKRERVLVKTGDAIFDKETYCDGGTEDSSGWRTFKVRATVPQMTPVSTSWSLFKPSTKQGSTHE